MEQLVREPHSRIADHALHPSQAMSTKLSSQSAKVDRRTSPVEPLSLIALFGEQLEALYGLVQRSNYVFGSPLGPFHRQARTYHVPRFVYFGPDASAYGPLTMADDQPFHPFELTLRIPAAWSAELYREAVASILKRFVLRYRGIVAYGQNL